MGETGDGWSRWLLETRFGGSEQQRRQVLAHLATVRDRVLSGASLAPGDVVVDVGCGDGLLGFAALDRTAPSGRVVFTDVSQPLLDHCRAAAERLGVLERCAFSRTGLPSLAGVGDATADAVVLRSVLVYVEDKAAAMRGLHRVLRPGGRMSLFEPVNAFAHPEPPGWLWGLDVTGLEALAGRVRAAYGRHAGEADAMLGFDERDLLALAGAAGFGEVSLTYEATVSTRHPGAGLGLDALLATPPNPTLPAPA